VNEVQVQAGKKISETASTALIAKAQEVVAALVAVIPVTGGKSTEAVSTALPSDPMPENLSKPIPMGTQVDHQTQWDAFAAQVVQSVGFTTFNYDLYQLPADSSWDDTLAYYTTEAATAGWGTAPRSTDEMTGGHYAVWSVTGPDGTTNYFVVAQAEANDNTLTLNIIGSK
jgi:hypothetical protein